MLRDLALVARDPRLRMIAIALALIGIINASLFPYQSFIAIDRIGLSDGAFALVLLLAAVVGVVAAVLAGVLSDQRGRRRQVALATSALTLAGPLAMWLHPSALTLVLCHAVLLPISGSLFGQVFALARLASAGRPEDREGVLATLRACLSLAFVIVLPLWSVVLDAGLDLMAVYAVATLAAALILILVWRDWPGTGHDAFPDPPSGLSLRRSLAGLGRAGVLARIAILGLITAATALYMTLVSLVFAETPGRGAGDTALFAGLVAGFEVPFMLLLGPLSRRVGRLPLLAGGAVLYGLYLALLPVLAPHPAVWALPVLAGLGGAAILTLPIGYLQDLLQDRPGAGSSLMAVQKVVADVFCAVAFAAGTAIGGYGTAALIGAAGAVVGAGLLWLADRGRAATGVAASRPLR